MNASQSPILNITNPFPGTNTPGLRSGSSQSAGSGEPFDAVYDSERASSNDRNSNYSLNNNEIESEAHSTENKASNATGSEHTEEHSDELKDTRASGSDNDITPLNAKPQQETKLSEDGLETDEQLRDETILSGIGLAQAVTDKDIRGGQDFPVSGKKLPAIDVGVAKPADLSKNFGDAEVQDLMEQSDIELDRALFREGLQSAANRSQHGYDNNELLKQDKLAKLSISGSDYFQIEGAADATIGKNSAEAILENLAFLGTMTSKEPPSTSLPPNTFAASAIAAPNMESQLSPPQALISGSAESLETSLNVRGNSTDWSQAIGDKIRWMRNASVSTAELHLNPAELGSIEIKIVTEDQQARVSFVTTSNVAQEMIEESMSKLKELLSDHGIALDQSDISQKGNQSEFAQEDRKAPAGEAVVEQQFENEAALSTSPAVASRIGQVDHYV